MTFNVDANLTIDIYDLIKSKGGKITVYKELRTIQVPIEKRKEIPSEPEYDLTSMLFRGKKWDEGWNYAECGEGTDPIPLIVTTGHTAGQGMFHAWLEEGKHTIPFEARLEDFHFAGHEEGLVPGRIQLGFKKLYLYKVDRELGIKMLLECKDERNDSALLQMFQTNVLQQQIAALSSQNFPQMFGAQTRRMTASEIRAQQDMAMYSPLASLGGALSGNREPSTPHSNLLDYDPRGPSEKKHSIRILDRIKRVFSKTSRVVEPDNTKV